MNRKKRRAWILEGNFRSEHVFKDVEAVLKDLGYRLFNQSGSHGIYVRGNEEEQKTVPTVGGRFVKKCYLKAIRDNAVRIWGEESNG